MYDEDVEVIRAIVVIMLIAILCTIWMLFDSKEEHDRIATAYAPDQAHPYESMEDELKAKRKMLDDKILLDGIKNYYFENGYNKAIDDFEYACVQMIKKEQETRYGYLNGMDIREIAKKLKVGEYNER